MSRIHIEIFIFFSSKFSSSVDSVQTNSRLLLWNFFTIFLVLVIGNFPRTLQRRFLYVYVDKKIIIEKNDISPIFLLNSIPKESRIDFAASFVICENKNNIIII